MSRRSKYIDLGCNIVQSSSDSIEIEPGPAGLSLKNIGTGLD
jgi:hypothetical protein